jgi:hypothetical protein
MPMKYLIVQTPDGETPVIFPDYMYHNDFEEMLGGPDVVAAGLIEIVEGKVRCSGSSLSLGIDSRGEDDQFVINQRLSP